MGLACAFVVVDEVELLLGAVLGRASASALVPMSARGSRGPVELGRVPRPARPAVRSLSAKGDVQEPGGFEASPPKGSASKIPEIPDAPFPNGFSLAVEDRTVRGGSLSPSPDSLRALDPSTEPFGAALRNVP